MPDPFASATPFASPTPFWDQGGPLPGSAQQQTPTTTIIEPPDDRYLPGYSTTDADGNTKAVGPKLKDLNIPFSLYGLAIPITFGVRRLYGNIIWAIPLRENVKRSSSGGGKGGGGPKEKTTTYEYFATFAVGFGYPGNTDAAKRDIIRIWADGTLIYDRRGTGRAKIAGLNFNFYRGTEDQLPDPVIESKEGQGEVPAYRGMMYLVINDMPVAQFGDRPPAISVEIGDATSAEYIVKNIATPDVTGTVASKSGLATLERGLFWKARGTSASRFQHLFQYNLVSRTCSGPVPLNQGDGIGFKVNDLEPSDDNLAHLTGTDAQGWCYIPWLHMIAAFPAPGGAGCNPVFLMDADSGEAVEWIGCTRNWVNFDYGHFYDSSRRHNSAEIPGPTNIVPFQVPAMFSHATILGIRSLYGKYGFLLYDPYTTASLELIEWFDGRVVAMCPGEWGLGFGTMYIGVNPLLSTTTTIKKYTGTGQITAGKYNDADEVQPPIGVSMDEDWYSFPFRVTAMLYVANDHSLIVWYDKPEAPGNGAVSKIDVATQTIIWDTDLQVGGQMVNSYQMHQHDISGGTVSWHDGLGAVFELDLTFGDVALFTEGTPHFNANTPGVSDSRSRCIWASVKGGSGTPPDENGLAGAIGGLFYDRLSDDRMDLADFILGMALYAGYDEDQIFIDPNIDDEIDGAMITNITSYRSIINSILAVYGIDVIESGGQVKFIRKAIGAGSVVFEIEENQLLGDPDQPEAATHRIRREEEIAAPSRVNIKYIDKSLGYQWSNQFASRSSFINTNDSTNSISYEIPIIMEASEAKSRAMRALYGGWNSRVAHAFTVRPEFLRIEPGDVGTVTSRGITYTIKAVDISYNTDFSMTFKAQNFLSDEAIVVQADSGSGYDVGLPPVVNAEIFVLDIPLLRLQDDTSFSGTTFPLYHYNGPLILTGTWGGAVAMMSRDFINFTDISANTSPGFVATCGSTLGVPEWDTEIDTTSELLLYPKSGDKELLESCTYTEMLSIHANVAAVGRPGRWELIQFQDVVDNGDGSFTISNLLRARRGSDVAAAAHAPGDTFILIDPLWVDLTVLNFADINKFLDFKAVGFGQSPDDVLPKRVQIVGQAALPQPPVNIQIYRELGGDGTLHIQWMRRTRTEGPLVDSIEMCPLTDYEENDYKVTIWRWPHYQDWEFEGGEWVPVLSDSEFEEYLVTNARELTLDATAISAAELYEFSAPDTLDDEESAFSQVGGDYIIANDDENLIIEDLGYGELVRFKYLDIMVQQKTNVSNGTGYGPARKLRIPIRDVETLP